MRTKCKKLQNKNAEHTREDTTLHPIFFAPDPFCAAKSHVFWRIPQNETASSPLPLSPRSRSAFKSTGRRIGAVSISTPSLTTPASNPATQGQTSTSGTLTQHSVSSGAELLQSTGSASTYQQLYSYTAAPPDSDQARDLPPTPLCSPLHQLPHTPSKVRGAWLFWVPDLAEYPGTPATEACMV